MDIWVLKNTVEEMGNVINSLNRMDQLEEKNLWSRRQDLQSCLVRGEWKKEVGKKKVCALWNIIKRSNLWIIRVPEGEKKGKRGRKLIYGNNGFRLLKSGERFDRPWIDEAFRSPKKKKKINSETYFPRDIKNEKVIYFISKISSFGKSRGDAPWNN